MVQFKRFDKIAYGKPKEYPKSGKVINTGSRIGTKIVQLVYFRPVAFGARFGKARK